MGDGHVSVGPALSGSGAAVSSPPLPCSAPLPAGCQRGIHGMPGRPPLDGGAESGLPTPGQSRFLFILSKYKENHSI